jgi:ribosomal protein S18 acetylase RimI-like enzyme
MILGENQQFASPEEALVHFGIKGMHWGVRKERARNLHPLVEGDIVLKTKNGDELTLTAKKPNKLNKTLAFISKNAADAFNEGAYLTVKDKDGKKVGSAQFWNKDKDSVYLNWISVDKHARGLGYATTIMKAAEEHSRAAGKKRMLLEVPGISPDARHIYEKMGFKVTKEPTTKEAKADSVWGGLTHMEKRLD